MDNEVGILLLIFKSQFVEIDTETLFEILNLRVGLRYVLALALLLTLKVRLVIAPNEAFVILFAELLRTLHIRCSQRIVVICVKDRFSDLGLR